MDKSDQFFPRDAREKVIVYQLLSELKTYTENNNQYIFGIFPCTDTIPKDKIRKWINEQFQMLAQDDE